jgi:hypothetical protein
MLLEELQPQEPSIVTKAHRTVTPKSLQARSAAIIKEVVNADVLGKQEICSTCVQCVHCPSRDVVVYSK